MSDRIYSDDDAGIDEFLDDTLEELFPKSPASEKFSEENIMYNFTENDIDLLAVFLVKHGHDTGASTLRRLFHDVTQLQAENKALKTESEKLRDLLDDCEPWLHYAIYEDHVNREGIEELLTRIEQATTKTRGEI